MSEYDPLLTMSALNMAIVSLHRITSSGDRLILDREYDSIINNLNMGEINADPELMTLYDKILKVIQKGRLRDDIREEINTADSQKKQKSIGQIISGNILKSFSTNPLKWIGKLAMSSASEYFTQRKESQEESEKLAQTVNDGQLKLKREELDEYDELQRKLLVSSWSLLRQYHLPDNYRLTQRELAKFSAVMNEPDPSKRLKMMKYLERDFAMYAPYWFYRAKSAHEAGNNDEAEKYFARFGEVWRPALKKDQYRAEAMKFRIESLMRNGVTQENAGEILKCLEEMKANTETEEWANNIFAGMVYFALGRKDEAVDCVMCNVLFNYENEMSNKVLERMETEELPPRIEPLPEKIEPAPVIVPELPKPEPPKPEPQPMIHVEPVVHVVVQTTPPAPQPEPPKSELPKPKPQPKVQETPPAPKPKRPLMSDNDFLELCKSGDAVKVEEAIMNGANVYATGQYGKTALMWAAEKGHTETVELLINHGADIHAKDNDGWTALMEATFWGNTETAEWLINHGADIHANDDLGSTALMRAAFHGHTETAKMLINH
ncbi:MAG: ankyrin repeat domain-containing protein, partial [Synergistaceae bacterium]|nr:ankyrin repeat domain-containing protein [Synergistaceae bacterium]